MNRIQHYLYYWPDPVVSPDTPDRIYYEVDTVDDVVLRTVDVFADGRIQRNSIAIEERNGDVCPSLVDGPFMEYVGTVPLELIPEADFESVWKDGRDTPFWFQDGFPKFIQF